MNNQCVIIRSYPGSGKTTFANKMFPNCLKLENDQFFYHNGVYEYDRRRITDAINWCIDMADLSLRRKMDCVISNTFTKKRFVDAYKRIAELHGADFKVYRMMGDFKNIHDVPENVFNNMKNNFEDYPGEIFVYPDSEGCENGYRFSEVRL